MFAALLAAYGDRNGNPNTPAVEEILIIEPPLFFLSIGIAHLVNTKCPIIFVFKVLSQSL